MRFFTVLALAGAAVAAPELQKRQSANATSVNTASIYGVLITALPSSLLAEATNTAKLSSDIAAEFETTTPSWFSALPTDVKSYLLAQGSSAVTTTRSGTAGTAGSTGVVATTNRTTVASPTLSSTSTTESSASSAAASSSSSSSSGGASIPTAIVGGGVAGLIGLAGMLAL